MHSARAEPEVVPVLEELPKWGLLTEVMQVQDVASAGIS